MKIRLVDPMEDLTQVLLGAHDFVEQLDLYRFISGSPSKMAIPLTQLITSPNVRVVVADNDGELVAGLGVAITPCVWESDTMQVEELFWWARPDAPRNAAMQVLEHGMQVAKDYVGGKRALVRFAAEVNSRPGVARVYKRMGLTPVETVYMGVMNNA